VIARYMVPVSTKGQPMRTATRLPTLLFPEATGPSMAIAVLAALLLRRARPRFAPSSIGKVAKRGQD